MNLSDFIENIENDNPTQEQTPWFTINENRNHNITFDTRVNLTRQDMGRMLSNNEICHILFPINQDYYELYENFYKQIIDNTNIFIISSIIKDGWAGFRKVLQQNKDKQINIYLLQISQSHIDKLYANNKLNKEQYEALNNHEKITKQTVLITQNYTMDFINYDYFPIYQHREIQVFIYKLLDIIKAINCGYEQNITIYQIDLPNSNFVSDLQQHLTLL